MLLTSAIISFLFVLFVLIQLRESALPSRFAILWMFVALLLFLIPIFSEDFVRLSKIIFGFEDATNFLYVLLFGFVLTYSFLITIYLVSIGNKVQVLISKIAILEAEIGAVTLAGK